MYVWVIYYTVYSVLVVCCGLSFSLCHETCCSLSAVNLLPLTHDTRSLHTHTYSMTHLPTFIYITGEIRLAKYDMTLTHLLHIIMFGSSNKIPTYHKAPLCLVYTHVVYMSEQPSFCNC